MTTENNKKSTSEAFGRQARSPFTFVYSVQVAGVKVRAKSNGSIASENGKIVTYNASETTLQINDDTLEITDANISRDGIVRGGTVKLNGQEVAPNCDDGVNLEKLGGDIAKVYTMSTFKQANLNMSGPRC